LPAHKREIDEAEVIKYALAGCYDKTIARLTGIPESTLKRRCGALISKKRAERKYNIRKAQNDAIAQGNTALLIFLGKNELDQTDKQVITTEHKLPELSEAEQKAYKAMAEDWKLRIARQGADNVQRQDRTA